MPFLQGAFSAHRFTARPIRAFDDVDVGRLANHNISRTIAGEDGVQVGWSGGDHEQDGELSCEKNLRGDFLQWAFRVTKFAPPAGRVKATHLVELKAVMDAAGVQVPTSKMKREARESAQAMIEEEGRDGRYHKHTLVPVVWDGTTGQVWYGSASHAHLGRFADLFRLTFGVDLSPVTAGSLNQDAGSTEAAFGYPVWCGQDDENWIGNEFALWLLWAESRGVSNGAVGVPAFRLTLSDPSGLKGTDVFTVEMPTSLPEVMRAIQDGKLPRSTGLVVVADGQSMSLTLDPEMWVVSGVKLPELEDVPPGPHRDVQRLEQCRGVFRSLDTIYGQFLDIRLGDGWAEVVEKINQWTGRVPEGVA